MINITLSPNFKKVYSKRIKGNKKLVNRVSERLQIFQQNYNDCSLKNHQLIGPMKYLYSFSITGDIRIIYQWIDQNTVLFLDIGTHNQVY